MAIDDHLGGALELRAALRPEVKDIIQGLRQRGIKHLAIISGDHEAPTKKLAEELGMDRYFAQVLPADKADYIHRSGRTGRAGASGMAITFISPSDARLVADIEKLVQDTIPKQDLEEVISNTGLYFGDAARFAPNTGNHTAFVLVNLVTGHEGKTEDYVSTLRTRLRESLPGVEVSFQTGGIISDVLNFGLRAPIDIQVKGPSLDLIRPVAEAIQQKIAQVPNTVDVRIKQGKSYPELHIDVDRTKAAYYGITQDRVVVDVITGISSNIALSPNYWLDPKTANGYFLLAQYPEQSLTKTEDLLNIPIIGARTALGPTSSLTAGGAAGSTVKLPGPNTVWEQDGTGTLNTINLVAAGNVDVGLAAVGGESAGRLGREPQ
mgnify:CR=1 FL=1